MGYSNYTNGEMYVELDFVDDTYLLTYYVFECVGRFSTNNFLEAAKMFSDVRSVIECGKDKYEMD